MILQTAVEYYDQVCKKSGMPSGDHGKLLPHIISSHMEHPAVNVMLQHLQDTCQAGFLDLVQLSFLKASICLETNFLRTCTLYSIYILTIIAVLLYLCHRVRKMCSQTRLEPGTPRLQGECSTNWAIWLPDTMSLSPLRWLSLYHDMHPDKFEIRP